MGTQNKIKKDSNAATTTFRGGLKTRTELPSCEAIDVSKVEIVTKSKG